MDDKGFHCVGLSTNNSCLNAIGRVSKIVQAEAEDYTDTTLRLNSLSASCDHLSTSKGIKRKWDATKAPLCLEDGSSVFPRFDHSCSSDRNANSAATSIMSSLRDTDEESSMDLSLNFHLHLNNENSLSAKANNVAAPTAPEMGPKFDLELSLSTGSSESDLTCLTPSSTQHSNSFEMPFKIGTVSPVEKVSMPSDQNLGSIVSSFCTSNTSSILNPIPSRLDPVENLSRTEASTLKSSATLTSWLTRPTLPHRSSNSKNCQFKGCGKGARGASGLCIAHGGGRRCQKSGCHKGAEGRTVYCKAHGGGRRCQYLGCTKSAEGCTDCCIAHGGGRRCSRDGCTRAARGKSGLCIRHGGGKRCQMENCTKSAEGFSGLCISHGGGRRCQYPSCWKGSQGSTMFCKAHGGGKRCNVAGCAKGAEGSTPFCKGHGGGKRCSYQGGGVCRKSVHGGTQLCVAHGGGKRCAVPECTKSARGRTDFCVRHGGGKRCKYEHCGKSAQGSTDFCKAHGGGKRCSWGEPVLDIDLQTSCDRFARGKTGLCAGHSSMVQDPRVHGGGTLGSAVQEANPSKSGSMKAILMEEMQETVVGRGNSAAEDITGLNGINPTRCTQLTTCMQQPATTVLLQHPHHSVLHPEGRVHGGDLMKMLAGCGRNEVEGDPTLEQGACCS